MKTIILFFLLSGYVLFVSNPALAQEPTPFKDDPTSIKGLAAGKAIYLGRPIYSKEAIEKRISGSVLVKILIDESGNVIDAKALTGDELLHSAAENAALKSRFTPTTLEGKPIRVSASLTFNFTLFDDWEGVGATLSTLATGHPGKSYGKRRLDLNWHGFEEERDALDTLQLDEGTEGKSTKAKQIISSLREKLKIWNSTALWYFNLGILTSELTETAVKTGAEDMFVESLKQVTSMIDRAPSDIPEERIQVLRKAVSYAQTGVPTRSERTEIIRLLIDSYNKKLTTIQ
jgi:TonB family protein